MKRRPRRGLPAALTALLLLTGCVLLAISAIQMLAGRPPLISYHAIAEALHDTRWTDPLVTAAGGGTALLGLILLLTAILPGKPTVLPLAPGADPAGDTSIDSGISRHSLRNTLRTAARAVDGVNASTLTLARRTVRATVRTDRTNTTGLADAVRSAIEHRLDDIAPATRPTVKVKVHAPRSAS